VTAFPVLQPIQAGGPLVVREPRNGVPLDCSVPKHTATADFPSTAMSAMLTPMLPNLSGLPLHPREAEIRATEAV
jgi:hypothetical protein